MARKPKPEAGAKKAPYRKATAEEKPKSQEPSPFKIKRPKGRPSTYDPKFCEMVLDWGAEGKSRTAMAALIGVLKETLLEWANKHPEFSAALTRAKQLEQLWWENAGQHGMLMMGFSAGGWGRNMAARFPEEWRESKNVNHGVQDSLAQFLEALDGQQPRIPTAA